MTSRGIKRDLRERLERAHDEKTCLPATNASDLRRLRYAHSKGELVMPAPRVFALPDTWRKLKPVQRESYRVRALAQVHPSWVFASYSAAAIHGLAVTNALFGDVHLACARTENTRDRTGMVRHVISNDAIEVIDGVKVTSLARTTFDCVNACSFRAGLAIADSALRVSYVTRDELLGEVSAIRGRRYDAWRVAETMRLADGRAENGGESVVRAILFELGFMIPDLQVEVPDPLDPSSAYRVDFCWDLPGGRVVGELDGKEKYTEPCMTDGRTVVEVLTDERLRESRVTCADAKVMRFSYRDAVNTGWFRRLLTTFGIPSGFEVPEVARIRR